MSDPFAQLIPEARSFLSDLAAHNTRDWFADQKPRYDTTLKTPATHLMDQIKADLARDPGWSLNTKLFRPQRDVRFSKDKTPYHVHLHMLWSFAGDGGAQSGLFFGISPTYVRAGGGIMGFEKSALHNWRTAVDGSQGVEIAETLAALAKHGLVPGEPDLKRVPSPFDKEHPRGDLLRRKGLTVWTDMPQADWTDPVQTLTRIFRHLTPLMQQLNRLT